MRISRVFIPLLLALAPASVPSMSSAQKAIGVSITIAPPELPDYDQPPIPAPGYIWTPGYWAYGDDGYYWVPGTWVEPPEVGLLWTPGYWDWSDDVYVFHDVYWGPHVGFYGGVDYGYGYGGVGYEGGYWNNGVFAYNRTVNNFGGVTVTNVYNKTIINNTTIIKVSFHGGASGTKARRHQRNARPNTTPSRADCDANPSPGRSPLQPGPASLSEPRPAGDCGNRETRRIQRPRRCAARAEGPVGGPGADHGHAGPGPDHMHDTHKGPPLGGPAHGQTASAPPNAPHPMDARRQAHPVEAKAPPHPPASHPVRAAASPRPPAPHPMRAAAPRPHPAPHPVARAAPKKGKHG